MLQKVNIYFITFLKWHRKYLKVDSDFYGGVKNSIRKAAEIPVQFWTSFASCKNKIEHKNQYRLRSLRLNNLLVPVAEMC